MFDNDLNHNKVSWELQVKVHVKLDNEFRLKPFVKIFWQ